MGGHVLLVENNPDLQRRLEDALRAMGFSVTSEAELGWALRRLDARAPDAVVTDTWLPDGTGFQIAKELRRTSDTRHVPVVFLASREHRGASHRVEALRRFAPADYFQAPVQAALLATRLVELLPGGAAALTSDAEGTVVVPPPLLSEIGVDTAVDPISPGARPGRADGLPTGKPPADPSQVRERREVEKTARTLAHGESEWKGSLRRTSFAVLLRRLFARKAEGALLLLGAGRKKIVTFRDGYPVSVKSNVLSECLGQILVVEKLISPEALQESVRRLRLERRHQGEILVEMGVLSPHNLQRALAEQLEAKVVEIFSWTDGQFMFKEGRADTVQGGPRLGKSPAALVLEGVRRFYDAERKTRVLAPLAGRFVALTADPVLRFQDITRDEEELAFLADLDGRAKLETVLATSRLDEERARTLLVAAVEAGIAEGAEGPLRRAPLLPPMEGRDRPAGPAAVGPSGVPLVGPELALVAETVRNQNYFWTLGVSPDATSTSVERAYAELAGSFHPDRYRALGDGDRSLAGEVFARLGEAYRVLREPGQRRAYAARLEKKGEEGPVRLAAATPAAGPGVAAEQLFEVGTRHLASRRYHQAVESLRQAARAWPDRADFRAALGWALFHEAPADARAGRAALAELRRAVQLDPRNVSARRYLGLFYAQTGQTELAITELEALLELDPTSHDVAEELARLRG
jgi:DNA-binding response OmpR family regulator